MSTGYEVVDDEFVTPIDEKGETKITKDGELLGGRKFRVKTFKVPGKGDKMYTISTDVARLIGYRDSYFLFQKHLSLFRVRVNDDIKMGLINDGHLPNTFKTRAVYLITAKAAFKEFGSRVIMNGRQIIDDYYEQLARDSGAIEGALMNPLIDDSFTSMNATVTPTPVTTNTPIETDLSWIYDNAIKCRQFESGILYDRLDILNNQHYKYDLYSNLNFVPSTTQSTKSHTAKISNDNHYRQLDTIIVDNNIVKTGVTSIPDDIFIDCVDEATKMAILKQKRLEQFS